MENFKPGYIELFENGTLKERVKGGMKRLLNCDICPHNCGVNRLGGEKGFCRTLKHMIVSSYAPHFGEEKPLVGENGSGTIFFAYCNLRCVFCQNYDISCGLYGQKATAEEAADMMIDLQEQGCHNINLVTPTQFVPQILESLEIAAGEGLKIPLVYNSGGYDSVKTLKLLDGIVDIYMPDIKYADEKTAKKYSGIRNYPQIVREAVKEMYRQVGNLITDKKGIAQKGLIIRHLVLPHGLSGTEQVMKFIAEKISPDAFVNVMAQYYPAHKAHLFPELSKRLSMDEFQEALKTAEKYGIRPRQ